ncbi:MAG TPA: hypothetical protein VIY49_31560 [Bryobacteraceae bacterium]
MSYTSDPVAMRSQDAIVSQILATLADEEAWKRRFAQKRDVIRRLAHEALQEDGRGETLPFNHADYDRLI